MSEVGAALVLLAGVAFGALVAWRIWSGTSYISNPAMQVHRRDDPFSFWLSLAFPVGVAMVLTAGGIFGLWRAFAG